MRTITSDVGPQQAEIDKLRIAELLVTERSARDMGRWDKMVSTYSEESLVDISWFQGSGIDFVDASRKHYETGARSLHQMCPPLVTVQADRALSDTGCAVVVSGAIGDIEVNVVSYARMHNRYLRERGDWRIAGLRVIYQNDMLVPVNPADSVPFDGEKLKEFRPSYRLLSYLQFASGLGHYTPRSDLPGVDRPDLVERLLLGEDQWLMG